jgi:hypothetical protein
MRKGYCKYLDVVTRGVLSMDDLATMNEVIDFEQENEARARQAADRSDGSG